MKNEYQTESYEAKVYSSKDFKHVSRELSRPWHTKAITIKSLKFDSPYQFSTNGMKNLKLTKTGLETIRRYLRIPHNYQKLISPGLMTENINYRAYEVDEENKKSILMVSRFPDFHLVDGFVPLKAKPVLADELLNVIQPMIDKEADLQVRSYLGAAEMKIVKRNIQLEVRENDIINPGIRIHLPRIIGKHEISLFYERVVCSNGMTRIEKDLEKSFSMTKPPLAVLTSYEEFLLNNRNFERELMPIRFLSELDVDERIELPFIEKFYVKDFPAIENIQGGTYYDVYNILTERASQTHSWEAKTLSIKAAKLLELVSSKDTKLPEKEIVRQSLRKYFRVDEEESVLA